MQNSNFMMNFARAARASTGIHKEPQDPGQSTSEVTTPEIYISLINKRQREHHYQNNMEQNWIRTDEYHNQWLQCQQ